MNSKSWLATYRVNPLDSYSTLASIFNSINCCVVCIWRQAARGMGGAAPLSPGPWSCSVPPWSAAGEQEC